MNPIVRNILAVIVGWLSGSVINMSLVKLGHSLFPIEGINPNNMEELAAAMPHLDFQYFIFPFLAHALGTFGGATIAALIAASHKMKFALTIGALFLIGGIIACFMIPAPTWFIVADLVLAYIPLAWLGGRIGICRKKSNYAD